MSELATPSMEQTIEQLIDRMTTAVTRDRKVLFFGNGGSAATARRRGGVGRAIRAPGRALPAIALSTDTSILTAVANDYGFDRVFERQINGLAKPGDVAIALSTSGKSKNILRGLRAGTRRRDGGPSRPGWRTGAAAGRLPIVVPSSRVPLIQEAHDTIVHVLCEAIDPAALGS